MAIAASSEGGAMVRVDPRAVGLPAGNDEGHAYEHAWPGHAWVVARQFRRSAHRRSARPLGRDGYRVCALAAAQVAARPNAAPQPPADSRKPAASSPVLMGGVDGRLRRGLVRAGWRVVPSGEKVAEPVTGAVGGLGS